MVCNYCGSKTRVINSRTQKRHNRTWRRRKCTACSNIVTSLEAVDLSLSFVVKRKSHLEPFESDKLFISLYDSLKHRKTALADARALTDTVIAELLGNTTTSLIKRDRITERALLALDRFDKPAATHYGAFHPLDSR